MLKMQGYCGCLGVGASSRRYLSCFVLAGLGLMFAATAAARESLVLQLKWDHEFQFAGFYVAKEMGFYSDADLDVEIRSRVNADGTLKDVFDEVSEGRAQFAVAGPDFLIAAESRGDINILATIMQQSPMLFVARSGEFASPAQFSGKRVANAEPYWGPVETHALLNAVGAPNVSMAEKSLPPDLKLLLDNQVDLVITYAPSAYWQAMEMRADVDYFSASDYGVHLYGDTLIGDAEFVKANPRVSRRFLEASLRGWEYAMRNPEEVSGMIAERYKRVFGWYKDFAAYNRFEAENMRDLMLYPTVEIGHTSKERWLKTAQYFAESGFTKEVVDVDNLIVDLRHPPPLISRLQFLALLSGLGFLFIGGGFTFWWARLLNVKVTEKTAELKKLNEDLEGLVSKRTQELSVALAEAEAASKAKDRLVANVSHELRTPLNAIIGFSELARRDTKINDERGYLHRINISAKSLLSIINDLLDFSKVEADKLELELRPFSLPNLLSQIREILAFGAEEKGLNYEFNIDPALPTHLKGDGLRVQQVLTNLIGNAIKFTSVGAVTVSASVSDTDYDEGVVTVSFIVKDTGIGISPDKVEKMFEAFSQADASVTRLFGGTGLGLTITRYLVNLMGGTIFVISELGHGASFEVRIPFLLIASGDSSPDMDGQNRPALAERNLLASDYPALTQTLSEDAAVNPQGRWFGKRALLVEDNDFNAEVARGFLEYLGLEVDHAENGEKALEMIKNSIQDEPERYQIVFMDIQMPGWDGYETTQRILDGCKGFKVPIVAMTAHATEKDREACLKAGMKDFTTKPLDQEALTELLQRQLPSA